MYTELKIFLCEARGVFVYHCYFYNVKNTSHFAGLQNKI
jgi:hypothetical protein